MSYAQKPKPTTAAGWIQRGNQINREVKTAKGARKHKLREQRREAYVNAVKLGASLEEIKYKSVRKEVQEKIGVGPQKKETPAFQKEKKEELRKTRIKTTKAPKAISSPKVMAEVRTSSEHRREIMNWLMLDPEYPALVDNVRRRDQRTKENSEVLRLFGRHKELDAENKETISKLLDATTAERLLSIDFEKERIALLKKLETHFGDEFPEARVAYSRFVRAEERALKQRKNQKRPYYETKMARRIDYEELRAKPGISVRDILPIHEINDLDLKTMLVAARSPKQKGEEWEMAQNLTKTLEDAGVDVRDADDVIAAFARAAIHDIGTPARITLARAKRPKRRKKKRALPRIEEEMEEGMLVARAEPQRKKRRGVRPGKAKKGMEIPLGEIGHPEEKEEVAFREQKKKKKKKT